MNIYGVSFKQNGKVYYFNGFNLVIEKGTNVIVETEKGLQYGKVTNLVQEKNLNNLKDIIRIADEKDKEVYADNLKDADKALKNARKFAEELTLEMSILDASFTFDKRQLLFNFISDGRIDFRELAKRLAGVYRTRIELRQIGARDKAKEIGGYGQCGRSLCCATHLGHIDAVTINMAKNQNIALNPGKINGVCGRLLCCLKYEDDCYKECRKNLPSIGQMAQTKEGLGRVISVDILAQKFKVDIPSKGIIEVEKDGSN